MTSLNELRSHFFQEAEMYLSIYDKDLNCLDINEAFVRLYNCTRDDLVGKNLCEISPDLKSKGRYDLYMEVIRTGKAINIDEMQPHPSIGNLYFRIRAFKVGEGLGLIVKDITDLVESVERFNYAVKASREIIYEWDISKNTFWWNDMYYELTGVENRNCSLGPDSWTKFIHPDDRDEVLAKITNFLQGEGTYWSGEYRFVGRNKEVHYFAERAFIIRDNMGQPSKKIASVSDISHWQLNINHLEDVLFSLSHKVRQPVAHIIGVSDLLDKESIGQDELKRITGYLKNSVGLLDTFTKEITSLVADHKIQAENKNWK